MKNLFSFLALLCLCGCIRSNYNLATQRQEYTMTSTDKEIEVGRKIARQVRDELTVCQ
jgi:hypothetical protein